MQIGEENPDVRRISRRDFLIGSAIAATAGAVALSGYGPFYRAGQGLLKFGEGTEELADAKFENMTGRIPESIVVNLDPSLSYEFVEAGDSLAAGYEGAILTGPTDWYEPKSWVEPTVQILNAHRRVELLSLHKDQRKKFTEKVGDYHYVQALAQKGLPSQDLVAKLKNPQNQKELSQIPNIVLCMSIGFNDLRLMFENNLGSPLSILGKLEVVLSDYRKHLAESLAIFKQIRRGRLNSSACLIIGLPDLDQVPLIKEKTRGTPLKGQTGIVATAMNNVISDVCHSEDQLNVGFVNLYDPKDPLVRSDFGPDGFHPDPRGYREIAKRAAAVCQFPRLSNQL